MRGQWQSQTRRLNRHYQSGGGERYTLFAFAENDVSLSDYSMYTIGSGSTNTDNRRRKIKLLTEVLNNASGYDIVLRQAIITLYASASHRYQWLFTNGVDYPNDPRGQSDSIIQMPNVVHVRANYPFGIYNDYYGQMLDTDWIVDTIDAQAALAGYSTVNLTAAVWLGIGGTSTPAGDFNPWSTKASLFIT